jgi:hypothetical protein
VAHLRLPALVFEAEIPQQAADLDYILPTTSLRVTQRFDKQIKGLKAGDSFTRTITIEAANIRAMLIPPTNFAAPAGLGVYAKEPVVDDVKTNRGEFVGGKRIDSATYLIRKEGQYELPAVQIEWWNLRKHSVEIAKLPEIQFSAEPNPGAAPELAPEAEPLAPNQRDKNSVHRPYLRRVEQAVIVLAMISSLLFLWLRFGGRTLQWWKERRHQQADSEAAFFANLRRAGRKGDARKTYALLLSWLNRLRPGVSLDDFLADEKDHQLSHQAELLARELYGRAGPGVWSGPQMTEELGRVRTRVQEQRSRKSALPLLNPVLRSPRK